MQASTFYVKHMALAYQILIIVCTIIGALSVSSARLPFLESPRTMGYLSMGTRHVQEIGYGCHNDVQVVHQKVLLSIKEHYTTKAQDEN